MKGLFAMTRRTPGQLSARKVRKPLTGAKALEILQEYLTWTVVEDTGRLLVAAVELQQHAKLSFWDALVVQAAMEAGCNRLYSQDLNTGQTAR